MRGSGCRSLEPVWCVRRVHFNVRPDPELEVFTWCLACGVCYNCLSTRLRGTVSATCFFCDIPGDVVKVRQPAQVPCLVGSLCVSAYVRSTLASTLFSIFVPRMPWYNVVG